MANNVIKYGNSQYPYTHYAGSSYARPQAHPPTRRRTGTGVRILRGAALTLIGADLGFELLDAVGDLFNEEV